LTSIHFLNAAPHSSMALRSAGKNNLSREFD
jgi:hypothetical protein